MEEVKRNSLQAWILAARPKTLTGAVTPVPKERIPAIRCYDTVSPEQGYHILLHASLLA